MSEDEFDSLELDLSAEDFTVIDSRSNDVLSHHNLQSSTSLPKTPPLPPTSTSIPTPSHEQTRQNDDNLSLEAPRAASLSPSSDALYDDFDERDAELMSAALDAAITRTEQHQLALSGPAGPSQTPATPLVLCMLAQ